jgi:hypothetical protein
MTGEKAVPRLAVVLLGAAEWPEWPELDHPAFAASHLQFRAYVHDDLRVAGSDVLDLFGNPDGPNDIERAVQELPTTQRIGASPT